MMTPAVARATTLQDGIASCGDIVASSPSGAKNHSTAIVETDGAVDVTAPMWPPASSVGEQVDGRLTGGLAPEFLTTG
jgi:hypothetical protein